MGEVGQDSQVREAEEVEVGELASRVQKAGVEAQMGLGEGTAQQEQHRTEKEGKTKTCGNKCKKRQK